jgi:formylglycine-generating enzyme required for sulfatase activity
MAVKTSPLTTCPRCDAPVKGDFKFCPTCAYRLKPGPATPPEPAPPARRLPYALLWVGGMVFAAGVVVAGMAVFADHESASTSLMTETPARPLRSLSVDNLLEEMVEIPPGVAFYTRPGPDLNVGPEVQEVPVMTPRLRCMKYEVTCGLYAQFLRDRERFGLAARTLEKLWRPDAEAREFSQGYVDMWWEAASAHLQADLGRPVERPRGLAIPLSDEFGRLLLVPPAWVKRNDFEEVYWEMPEGADLLPVTGVSWFDAFAFQVWAADRLQVELRIPLEGEWMRVAHGDHPFGVEAFDSRAQDPWDFPWGNALLAYACNNAGWWGRDGKPALREVDHLYREFDGTKEQDGRSVEGVYAMSGNAREWVLTHASKDEARDQVYYAVYSIKEDAREPNAYTYGGSFRDGVGDCMVHSRDREDKRARKDDVGFRLVITINK